MRMIGEKLIMPATRPESMRPKPTLFRPMLPLVRLSGWRFAVRLSNTVQKMFGKNGLVDNLSRDLDRARGKRDALASDVTTLTAQIAEMIVSLLNRVLAAEFT